MKINLATLAGKTLKASKNQVGITEVLFKSIKGSIHNSGFGIFSEPFIELIGEFEIFYVDSPSKTLQKISLSYPRFEGMIEKNKKEGIL